MTWVVFFSRFFCFSVGRRGFRVFRVVLRFKKGRKWLCSVSVEIVTLRFLEILKRLFNIWIFIVNLSLGEGYVSFYKIFKVLWVWIGFMSVVICVGFWGFV